MTTTIELVRGLNSIIGAFKHPMLNSDERMVSVHFNPIKTLGGGKTTEALFTDSEKESIYQTVIAICHEFGRFNERPNPTDIFFKCYLNEDSLPTWNIFKNGVSVIQIIVNTFPAKVNEYYKINTLITHPEWGIKGHTLTTGDCPPPLGLGMLKPVVQSPVNADDMGSWVNRIYQGSMIVLRSDMNMLHKLLKAIFVDNKIINSHAECEYDVLMSLIGTSYKVGKKSIGHGAPVPYVEVYFHGNLSGNPVCIVCPYAEGDIFGHDFAMMYGDETEEMKEWINAYKTNKTISVSLY